MPDRTPLIYPDTCVYLDVITRDETPHPETNEPRWKAGAALFEAWLDNRIRLATSPLVEAEVFCKSTDKRKRSSHAEERLHSWFQAPEMRWTDIDRFISRDAARLRDEYGHLHRPGKRPFGGADAVHLAAAVRLGCDFFMSYDGGLPIGHTVGKKLKVCYPRAEWDQALFPRPST
ncbi:type II toxin-antitoxin system VapC family toxin [Actinomadura flavalba]|uniref:type II toxin-antitoxin system VapC family toxin n=1 Tax=Actinomadura flavalba TaxID=1120938 RepID=UPI00035FB0C0|nr:PIN domain-containing protein [Actinomadura flavalba]